MALVIVQTTMISILWDLAVPAYIAEAAAVSSPHLGSPFGNYADSRKNLLRPCRILCRLISVESDSPSDLHGSRSSSEEHFSPSAAEWFSRTSGRSEQLQKVRARRSLPFDDTEPNNYDCENTPDDNDDGPFQAENCQRKPPSGHLHPTTGLVNINCDQDPAHTDCQDPAEYKVAPISG